MVDDRTALMSARALDSGYEILWYTINRVLGQGGFGITYLAHDRNLNRAVAIKEYLPTSFAYRREDYSVKPITGDHRENFVWGLTSFQKEAQTLARFSHPNIVRVNSVFEANNTAYMVMEYEHGENLAVSYKGNDKYKDQAFIEQVFFPIFDGLKEIHKFEFIHRDIKPANIYVRADGTPVLIDFGSARQTTQQQTGEMTALVSQGYTPLEQYSINYGDQGAWTDIYALAATIYEGIVGNKPEESLSRSACLMRAKPDPLVGLDASDYPDFTQKFLDAVCAGLKLEPEGRPQSIEEWAQLFKNDDVDEFAFAPQHGRSAITDVRQAYTQPSYRSSEPITTTASRRNVRDQQTRGHHDRMLDQLDRQPVAELRRFDDGSFDNNVAPLVNTDPARQPTQTSARARRKRASGNRWMFAAAMVLTALSAAAGYMYYTSNSDTTIINTAVLSTMPKPSAAIVTTLPTQTALIQLNHMVTLAPMLTKAYALNETDQVLLDTVQQTENSLLTLATTWNATRFTEVANRISKVSSALPAAVHDQDKIRSVLEAADKVSTYNRVLSLLNDKRYLRPSGESVLDSISKVNANDYSRLKKTDQWQQMMSELSQVAMAKLARSEFNDVAKLTEAALSLDADDPGFNALKTFLANP